LTNIGYSQRKDIILGIYIAGTKYDLLKTVFKKNQGKEKAESQVAFMALTLETDAIS